ncbi:hypothetical protein [Burkholderia arboris]|uniref:hypothetical protein n=1 Tax=Burkholderia arboris TaxID=488730 RepID=UPI00210C029B|nr:hypothetical protein [Burkholderia arboris]UTV56092.1 hypothetical protein NLX30_06855 [Burkholderia arboris]
MANGDSMSQPGPWQQRHEQELVEQRGSAEGEVRLHHALRYWFRRDTWTPDEALPLLIGIDPGSISHGDSHIRYLDGALVCIAASMHAHGVEWPIESFDDFGTLDDLKAVLSLIHEMKLMWESGNHAPKNAPGYFIEWAQRKGFKVPWLASARDLDLIDVAADKEPDAADLQEFAARVVADRPEATSATSPPAGSPANADDSPHGAEALPPIEPLRAVEGGTAGLPSTIRRIITRITPLSAEIEEAKKRTPQPDNPESVWGEFTKMAEEKWGILVGYSSDGVQYRGKQYEATQVPDVFTKKNLRDRMGGAKRRAR